MRHNRNWSLMNGKIMTSLSVSMPVDVSLSTHQNLSLKLFKKHLTRFAKFERNHKAYFHLPLIKEFFLSLKSTYLVSIYKIFIFLCSKQPTRQNETRCFLNFLTHKHRMNSNSECMSSWGDLRVFLCAARPYLLRHLIIHSTVEL